MLSNSHVGVESVSTFSNRHILHFVVELMIGWRVKPPGDVGSVRIIRRYRPSALESGALGAFWALVRVALTLWCGLALNILRDRFFGQEP